MLSARLAKLLIPVGILFVLHSSSLAAEQPAVGPTPTVAPPGAAPDASASVTAGASGDPFSFDLIEDKPTLSETELRAQAAKQQEIDRQVKRRRRILTAHQALGFTTLGVMALTLIVGQLNYNDKYGGGDDNGRFYNAHLGLSMATTGLFTSVGMLGVLAPNPYPKPIKRDLALLHKISMALATLGMVTQIVLGPVAAAREGHLDQRSIATTHLVVGYSTWAFMATGTLAYVF